MTSGLLIGSLVPETKLHHTQVRTMTMATISLKRQVLFNALSAVHPFASKDRTRVRICSVLFEFSGGVLNIVATDGHTLAWARPVLESKSSGDVSTVLGGVDTTKGLAATAATAKPSRTERGDVIELEISEDGIRYRGHFGAMLDPGFYPRFRHAIDVADDPGEFLVDPTYLERAAKACKAFLKGNLSTEIRGVRVCGGGLAPIRFDYSHPDFGALVCVIMPTRS